MPKKFAVLRRVGLAVAICATQAQNPPASVSVDANANRHAISPNIYGFASELRAIWPPRTSP